MKKLNLNLYESPYPPTDTNVFWVDVNESTGDIATIKKFENGEWVPCLTQGDGGSNPGDDLAEGYQYIEESFESAEPLTIKLDRTGEYGEYVLIEVWVNIPDFKYNYSGKDLRSNNSVYVGEITSRPDNFSYGGYIEANNVTIKTSGGSSATLATDRGEGTVIAKNSKLETNGSGSPVIYSTGDISIENTEGTANGSQMVVIEGKN